MLLAAGTAQVWRGRARAARVLLALGLVAIWVPSTPVVSMHLTRWIESRYAPVAPEALPSADAIVLLGDALAPPHPPLFWMDLHDSADRVLHAARIHRAGKAPIVVSSGGGGPQLGGPQKPAEAMADLLVEWGVPPEAVLVEPRSRNTYENALFTRELLDARGVHRVLLVTSAAHMLRSMAIFRSLGFDVIPAPTDFTGGVDVAYASPLTWVPDAGALRRTSAALKEIAGIGVYALRGWIHWPEIWRTS